MNKQIFELLRKIIINRGNPISVDDLSASMYVSPRMIYNYWKDICFYCEKINAINYISFKDGLFYFNGGNDETKYISACLDSLLFNEYRLNSEERIQIIAVIMAFSNYPIKNNYFEEIMFTSKNTVVADIRNFKKLIEENNIYFNKNKHNGLLLDCSNEQRLNIIIKAMEKLDFINEYYLNSPCNPVVSYLMKYLKIDKYRNIVEFAIKESENELNGKISDYNYFYMLFVISLLLVCYEQKKNICVLNISSQSNIYSDTDFIYKLSNKVSESFSNDDLLSKYIYENICQIDISFTQNQENNNPKYINTIVDSLLKKMSNYYNINLNENHILNEYLNSHITSCYHRILNEEILDNPYLEQIKNRYPKDFENLKNNIDIIENGLNISLNDGEIAYILLHILASIQREERDELPTIALICPSGTATSNFLSHQIKNRLKVNTITAKSVHDLKDLHNTSFADLIVSTIPIYFKEIPVVQVNAILQDEDYLKIIKSLEYKEKIFYENNKSEEFYSKNMFVNLLSKEYIQLNVEASDWREAIVKSAESLLWNEYITANYVHQMIDLVTRYGPYIVVAPGIALAHASPNDGVIHPATSLIRLTKPVIFNKEEFDPVSVVICIAIEDSPMYVNAMMQLISIIKNPSFMDMVINATSSQQIYDFLISERSKDK